MSEPRLLLMRSIATSGSTSVRKIGGAEVTRAVGKALVNEVKRQVEQDIPIWENKIHLWQPLLCEGDGPIAPYRRWADHFHA